MPLFASQALAPDPATFAAAQTFEEATAFSERLYFKLSADSAPALKEAQFSDADIQTLTQTAFWQMIVTDFAESHAEGYVVTNVMSDSFVANTTGAMPIAVSITGWLYTTPAEDHRLDFLALYHNVLRGTQLQQGGLVLQFVCKQTVMSLKIMHIQVMASTQVEDWTQIMLQGVGYGYQIRPYPATASQTEEEAAAPESDTRQLARASGGATASAEDVAAWQAGLTSGGAPLATSLGTRPLLMP